MVPNIFREWTHALLAIIVVYYVVMDTVLYRELQNTSLVKEAEMGEQLLYPVYVFHPLTVRLIVLDQTNHYVIKPLVDIFNYVTGIYRVLTSNVIIFCHIFVSIVVGRLVSSDNLRHRKIGLLLFEVRTWLVCLAGAVYRCRSGRTMYTSLNGVYGTTANTVFDVIGGLIFCGGVCFHQLRFFQRRREVTTGGALTNGQTAIPGKGLIISAFTVYGVTVVCSYGYLAYFIMHLEKFMERTFPDPKLTAVQMSLLHSLTTWVFLWMWRLFTQQMFQYLAVAVLFDRTWEFMKKGVIFFVPSICLLMSVCYIYIVHMNSLILGGEFNS